jgi:hypothetical protein
MMRLKYFIPLLSIVDHACNPSYFGEVAAIRTITVLAQHGQKVSKTPSQSICQA